MSIKPNHAKRATEFLQILDHAKWHDKALYFVRRKRDAAVAAVPEWEELRVAAEAIKAETLARLPELLETFETNCQQQGIHVHWAADGAEHNTIVERILAEHNATKIVKSKSMLTEECGLNHHLEACGVEIIDTDLGERIVQLRHETPSHIVMPAIHIQKEEVGELFEKEMGSEAGNADPTYLTNIARMDLRKRFLEADAGITGVNFAIAETGTIVVCTNEGNADLGTSLPRLHIACMGLEKIIPRFTDLGVFTRLLARSATGQPITAYTTHLSGPRPGGEMHIVIVDNHRSETVAEEHFRRQLACIRCGACLNTCPVYRYSGGHSYGSVIPGPIGAVFSPTQNANAHADLPFASTLCGSCTDVCPVKIDLHHQLLMWRERLAKQGGISRSKRLSLKLAGKILSRPWLYRLIGRMARLGMRLPRFVTHNRFNVWSNARDLPEPPKKTFRDLYRERQKEQGKRTQEKESQL